MHNPAIVCIGSNIESEIALKGLVDSGANVIALITRPARNQGNVSDYVDLHKFCEQNKIQTIDTINVNSPVCIESVKNLKADYLFTLGWSQIFSKDFINCFDKAVIGSHPTKLPEGKGRAPIPWTILLQKKYSAVSFFLIENEGVDDGEIILQKDFTISSNCNAWDLYQLVAKNLREGFLQLYDMIINGSDLKLISELDEKSSSIYAKRVPSDGKINFNQRSEHIDRLVRAVSFPYPGAYSFYRGEKIIFNLSRISKKKNLYGVVGQILKKEEDELLIKTGDGVIWLGGIKNEKGENINSKHFKIHDKLGLDIEETLFQLKRKLK